MRNDSSSKTVKTIGIDLAKSVFHLHGVDNQGKVVIRKRLSRSKLAAYMAQLPPCLVAMEACGGSHYWARKFQAMGHNVRLISPQFVKPYVKSNKNDMADAEAICEAVQRPNMRFVPIKSIEQQDILSIHRAREQVVRRRTAQGNQIRGLLMEYGLVMPQGMRALHAQLPTILADADNDLTLMFRELLHGLWEELLNLDKHIAAYDQHIKALSEQSEACKRVMTIPGVGPMVATALIASVSDGKAFKNGREMAAWLGLVARQHSTGGKPRLLGISKRGDVYLRKLLIHGARAALRWADKKHDKRSMWVTSLKERRGQNIAAVALANKTVRTAWVLITRGEDYRASASTI
ncbi:MAG: IS110 family transposase [Mariprofundaceae bacterium]|nr:IS110 family transposase [Mariprofundaceae bacterium]